MRTLTMILAAGMAAAAAAQTDSLEKAQVLIRVSEGQFRSGQITRLHGAAQSVRAAFKEHGQQMEALRQPNRQIEAIAASLALGRTLTAEQRQVLEQAARKRESLEQSLQNRIDAAVRTVITTLSEEQKYRMAIPEEIQKSVADALNSIRNASNEEWGQLRGRIAWQIAAPLLREMRQTQTRDRGDRGGERRRGGREGMSQDVRDIFNSANEYVGQMRGANNRVLDAFGRRLALSRVGEARAEQSLHEFIRSIITPESAVEALAQRLNPGR